MTHRYLFVLSPPFSGSTVLWRLLQTSPNVSAFHIEGQHLKSVRDIMRPDRWNPAREYPWEVIKERWHEAWDLSRPILLEKSPPHIVRAHTIEREFPGVRFIANMRDPYAFCEGYARRTGRDLRNAAEFWLMCAEHQRRNISTLEHIIALTYEEMTDDPRGVARRLLAFLPELETLDPDASFEAHSVLGKQARRLQNMNQIKIDKLSGKQLATINAVLEPRHDLLSRFGYGLRRPTWRHELRHWRDRIRPHR